MKPLDWVDSKRKPPFFLDSDIPEAWFEHRTWYCDNGHVSDRILISELKGDRCLECFQPVRMGPPRSEIDDTAPACIER